MKTALLPLALLSCAVGCGGGTTSQPDCTANNWRTCDTPTTGQALSMPWPEQRAELGALADATERAIATPSEWDYVLQSPRKPEPPASFTGGWAPYSATADLDRLRTIVAYDSPAFDMFNAAANYGLSQSPLNASAWVLSRAQLENAWAGLNDLQLYRDPFGSPEPRAALFSFARTATVMQIVSKPDQRTAIAQEAAAFIADRVGEWADLQRRLLAGRPEADVEAAIDQIGRPEIQRLTDAWNRLANVAFLAPE
jgi:hypothetical protein